MLKWLRILLVGLFSLVPLLTTFHGDELGRWTGNRCVMAAPDEPSYLLMAERIYRGEMPSIRAEANAETFYPPGFPLILAVWGRGATALGWAGMAVESLHVCVAVLLGATVPLVYLVAVRVLGERGEGREDKRGEGGGERGEAGRDEGRACGAALFIAGLYATNWYVMETGVFVFSEAAFTGVTLAWVLVGLRWPRWYLGYGTALGMSLLAAAAYAIRGAGVVCVAATVGYALVMAVRAWRGRAEGVDAPMARRVGVILLLAVVSGAGWAALRMFPRSSDDYGGQLWHGLTDSGSFTKRLHNGGRDGGLSVRLVADWSGYLARRTLAHMEDWVASFVPPYREEPEQAVLFGFVTRPGLYRALAVFFLLLGVGGFVGRACGRGGAAKGTRFVEVYVGLYVLLYALWPFDMVRFWVPIYPLMLIYGAMALRGWRGAGGERGWLCGCGPGLGAALAGLLLLLFAEELVLKLPYYQRRLNFVSDAIGAAARVMGRDAGGRFSENVAGGQVRVVVDNDDEAKLMAWYLGGAVGAGARAELRAGLAGREGMERQILAQMDYAEAHAGARVYVWSYFAHEGANALFPEVFENLRREHGEMFGAGGWTIEPRMQVWNISALWELRRPGQAVEKRGAATMGGADGHD